MILEDNPISPKWYVPSFIPTFIFLFSCLFHIGTNFGGNLIWWMAKSLT